VTELLPLVFTSGWASGINPYLVVLLTGLLGRVTDDVVPEALTRNDVLVVAAVLTAVDFVADKIAYVDSAWDAVNTVVRPIAGAVIAALIAGDASTLGQAVAATTGGLTAFASHSVKSGLRLAVNTSPEPASNVVVSLLEDLTVTGVVALAFAFPWLAAGVALTLLLSGTTVLWVLWRAVRSRRSRRGVAREAPSPSEPEPPGP
jgi:hypothetical protein